MIVEIRGTDTRNKGAELMFRVVKDQIGSHPGICFAVEPSFGGYNERAKYGVRTMLPERGRVGRSRVLSALSTRSFRDTYGLAKCSDLSAVLDSCGFAFGDQWGLDVIQYGVHLSEKLKASGIPLVFLPQAFGPFSGRPMQEAAVRLLNCASLVYARDSRSFQHLESLQLSQPTVLKSPDFTSLAVGKMPENLSMPDRFACIVPNIRMLDRTNQSISNAYVGFLDRAIRALQEAGISPYFLFHDELRDKQVAESLEDFSGIKIPYVSLTCPLELKGVLGKAVLVVGSRFHALVGALSQGIPVIATSWSHKYEELMEDYGIARYLVQPTEADMVATRIAELVEPGEYAMVASSLRLHADQFKLESISMFDRVKRELGLPA